MGRLASPRRAGRVACVAGLEPPATTSGTMASSAAGPWRNAYDAYDVGDRATTCAEDAKLEKALRGDLARTQGDVLLHLPSCSYPCGTAPATWDPDLPWLAAATEAAGFDLRVILATRRPRDIVRDPYNGFTAGRIATLTRSCRRLEAQLRRLDPRFLVCAPYPDAYANATKLSRFLGVASAAVAASFRPASETARRPGRRRRRPRAAFGLLEGARGRWTRCSSLSLL